MRMTPRLLATATVGFVSVAHVKLLKHVKVKGLIQGHFLVHGVPASVNSPARHGPSSTWSFPCGSLHSTAFMPTV